MPAHEHEKRYGAPIGEDYYCGDHWASIANALIGLLSGEIGELDAGTCCRLVHAIADRAGFKTDDGIELS